MSSQPVMVPNPELGATLVHPAIQYLNAFFSETDTICLTFIHATKKYKNGGAVRRERAPLQNSGPAPGRLLRERARH